MRDGFVPHSSVARASNGLAPGAKRPRAERRLHPAGDWSPLAHSAGCRSAPDFHSEETKMKNLWNAWLTAHVGSPTRRAWLAAIAATALGLAIGAAPQPAQGHDGRDGRENNHHWVGTWAASPQSVDPFTPANPASFNGQTIRQIVHTSMAGSKIRVRFTNELGAEALLIGSAHV